jgi:hypothetical protein
LSCTVELRCASLPLGLGLLADHYWFVVFDADGGPCHHWEVWQTADAGGRSFGHVHCDLKHPDAGVGGGRMRIVAQWQSEAAQALRDILGNPRDYPYCSRYFAWPGPNSNTYVAWVLQRAGLRHPLPRRALGKNYASVLQRQ